MKKLTKIIIWIVVLIVVVGLIYVAFFKKVEAPQNATVSSVPSNWKTYSVKSYDMTLQAPADFQLETNAGLADETSPSFNPTFILHIPTTTPYFHTHLINEVSVQVDQGNIACSQQEDVNASSTQVTINGVVFMRSLKSDVGAGQLYQIIDYTTTRNGVCYMLLLLVHSTNGEGFYTNDAAQIKTIDALQAIDIKDMFALFDQIAGTIKFTK